MLNIKLGLGYIWQDTVSGICKTKLKKDAMIQNDRICMQKLM
jgi:hypothetical protein